MAAANIRGSKLGYKIVSKERSEKLRQKLFWTEYHSKLQELVEKYWPGSHIVAHPDPDSIVDGLLTNGTFVETKATECELNKCKCRHEYVELDESKIESWMTGYVLFDDGLWRSKTWVTNKDGRIFETDDQQLAYWGIPTVPPAPKEIPWVPTVAPIPVPSKSET